MTGRVSRITGRRQAVALRAVTAAAALLSAAALLLPGRAGTVAGWTMVTIVVATPLLRVGWLMWRWWQERDLRFVALGAALIGVIAAGVLLTLAGVGV